MIASHRMSFMLNDVEPGMMDAPANDASGEIWPAQKIAHKPFRECLLRRRRTPGGPLLFCDCTVLY